MDRKGQSILEYSVLIIVVIAALIATGNYIKRSIQGRWKSAVDDFGDQYDPRTASGQTRYEMLTASNSIVNILPDTGVLTTQRTDTTNTKETVTSDVTVN